MDAVAPEAPAAAIDRSEELFKPTWPQLEQRALWQGHDATAVAAAASDPISADPVLQVLRPAERMFTITKSNQLVEPMHDLWEYLDHTADVQIHAWGPSLSQAFAAAVVALNAYMVDLHDIANDLQVRVSASGHDAESLLYAILDEALYLFATEQFVAKHVQVEHFDNVGKHRSISVVASGGFFDAARHSQGTEIKAITYSNMRIIESADKADVFVIVDI